MTTDGIRHLRRPLDAAELNHSFVHPGGLWREVAVVRRTGSTNAGLLSRASGGAPEGLVLAAEEQTAGRGRLGRSWLSPPRAALTFSVLLRPRSVPAGRRSWLPLLAGVATATAVREATGLHAALKWPNDVLVGERKLAGILAEQAAGAVVVGIGINVSASRDELPPPRPDSLAATSLLLEGAGGTAGAENTAALDRGVLLGRVLAALERWYLAWCGAPPAGAGERSAGWEPGDPQGCGLREAYRALCATLGRQVRAELPGGQVLSGLATDIDPGGRLVVRAGSAVPVAVAAGDVVHVR